MLRICPKIDDEYKGVDVISKYIKDMVEIQMTTKDINYVKNVIIKLMKEFPSIKEITVHSPMVVCDIEKNFDDRDRLMFMYSLMYACNRLSKEYKIRINMLYHCSNGFSYFKGKSQVWMFKRLINMMQGFKTYILLENVVDINFTEKGKEPCISTIRGLKSKKICMCLDVAHMYTVSELNDKDIISIYYNRGLSSIVHQVHFSKYKLVDKSNMYEHCENHKTKEELSIDIELLKKLQVDRSNIVIEVVEPDGYDLRKREIAELELINSYFKSK